MSKILFVEDEETLREEIVEELNEAGHQVVEAKDGEEAFDLISKCRPDLVLCDITMPRMNGPEFLKAIRSSDQPFQDTPFIYLTAQGDKDDIIAHLSMGAVDYIVKPTDFDVLHARIKSVLRTREAFEKKIQQVSVFDDKTGLPTYQWFCKMLKDYTTRDGMADNCIAVIRLFIGGYYQARDRYGDSGAERVMKRTIERVQISIKHQMAEADICVYGPGELVIMVRNIPNAAFCEMLAQDILTALKLPINILGIDFTAQPDMGISIWPNDSRDSERVLRFANLAMAESINDKRVGYQFYMSNMDLNIRQEVAIRSHLSCALERGELSLNFQPIIDMKSGQTAGAEALIRWNNYSLGQISPEDFIPIAEHTDDIIRIGRWVIDTAVARANEWHAVTGGEMVIAVNISPNQLSQPSFLSDIREVLDRYGFAPHLLELEVTERIAMARDPETMSVVEGLSKMGIRLSIDDFGTGYSALSMLRDFPMNTVKIDRSFIASITSEPKDAALCQTIISMSHALGVDVIAEGVETSEQLEFLKQNGCDFAQGYFLGRPEEKLKANNCAAA